MSLLEIRGLKKSFDGLEVLKDISLQVRQGEVLGIIGPSGSGKVHPSSVRHRSGDAGRRRDTLRGDLWAGLPEL